MIEVSKVKVYGWEPAIRGARNPMNSWCKSDTLYGDEYGEFKDAPVIGENDLALMTRLANAGPDHGKFLRMITVYMDINAPLYWWKEYDTYKVGTVANSCSTMHKIHAKEFTLDDFSHEKLKEPSIQLLDSIIDMLNYNREMFVETKKKEYWHQMIQLLPTSFNQLRTVELNYEVVRRMYHARKNHKLDEWHTLCREFEKLPYANKLIIGETK